MRFLSDGLRAAMVLLYSRDVDHDSSLVLAVVRLDLSTLNCIGLFFRLRDTTGLRYSITQNSVLETPDRFSGVCIESASTVLLLLCLSPK